MTNFHMTNVTNGNSAGSWRWQVLVGVLPVLLLGACAGDGPSEPAASEPETYKAGIMNHQTGEIHEVTVTDPKDIAVLKGETAEIASEKAGCVHIRFCTATFTFGSFSASNSVVCDTNDQVCGSTSRFNECNSDASFVCGKTRPMGFDPPIPCPITGLSTSICTTGESLVWISSSTFVN